MSDFDKEAEREKLRQQYEKDKEERKSTQRMSELLLQGATMTGKHCDTCGDPIFRHDGTEFCSTCQQEATANVGSEETAPEAATGIEVEQTGAESEPNTQSDGPSQPSEQPRQPRRTPPSQPNTSKGREQEPHQSKPQADTSRNGIGDAGDLTEARNALRRKLMQLAREAEKTNDVRHARELLAATREAAEALAALDRAKR